MRFKPLAITALWALLGSGTGFAGDELIEKVCKAYGNVDAVASAKTWGMTGVLKGYGGGLAKYDLTMKIRFPSDYRLDLEGFEGTYDTQADLVIGKEGWKTQREASRRLATDEVEGFHRRILEVDWLGRLKRGEQKFELLPDKEFDEVECAAIRLIGDPKRKITLYFDKSTWLLYRRDEETTDRAGAVSERYILFEEYEEFDGIQVPLTRITHVNQLISGTKEERFKLVRKVVLDEVTFSPEIEETDFQPPEDVFTVRGLDPDTVKKRAEKILGFFKGRRNPNQAGWACRALAELQAREAIQTLEESDSKDLNHYGYLALIRMGCPSDVPEDFQALAWKKKVNAALGYGKTPGKISVRYVGSSGFRLDIGGACLFVNAFYQPGLFHTAFPALDPKTVVKADVLLFSHAHKDHFDPWIAADVLTRTKAKAIAPPTVIALLKERGIPEDQLVPVNPGDEKPVSASVGKVKIIAFPVAHGSETTAKGKAEHVAYVIQVGDVKIVHFGEASKPKGMDEDAAKGADVIFLPHWMLKHKHKEFFKKINPRYIVPTCFMDTPGSYGSMKNLRDQWKKVVPLLPGHTLEF